MSAKVITLLDSMNRIPLHASDNATTRRVEDFAYSMAILNGGSASDNNMFEKRTAACAKDARLPLREKGGLAGWDTRVVRSPQQRDGSSCGAVSFMHM